MTTITPVGQQHTLLIAAVAAGAALVVGGAIGAAWEQSSDTDAPAATHTPSVTATPFGGATTRQEISGWPTGNIPNTNRFDHQESTD